MEKVDISLIDPFYQIPQASGKLVITNFQIFFVADTVILLSSSPLRSFVFLISRLWMVAADPHILKG